MAFNKQNRVVYAQRRGMAPARNGGGGLKRMRSELKTKLPVRIGRGSLQQQVKKLARSVRGTAPEIKYTDIAITMTDLAAAGAVVELTAIAAGTNQSERISDAIRVKSISLVGCYNVVAASNGAAEVARFCIVQDTQQIADTDVAITDIFTSTSPNLAHLNLDSIGRFKILWMSKFIGSKYVQDGSNGGNWLEYTWNGDIQVQYNGTAATDIQKNGLFFIGMSNDGTATSDLEGVARVGFTDA